MITKAVKALSVYCHASTIEKKEATGVKTE
jgi:hypothetical protein